MLPALGMQSCGQFELFSPRPGSHKVFPQTALPIVTAPVAGTGSAGAGAGAGVEGNGAGAGSEGAGCG